VLALLEAKLASSGHQNLMIVTRVVRGDTLDGLEHAFFDVMNSIFRIMLFVDRTIAWRAAWRVLEPEERLLATSIVPT
jgi:hypothetical protein